MTTDPAEEGRGGDVRPEKGAGEEKACQEEGTAPVKASRREGLAPRAPDPAPVPASLPHRHPRPPPRSPIARQAWGSPPAGGPGGPVNTEL